MNGRQENNQKFEKKIASMIKESLYDTVSDYYYSLIDKTPATKKQYIREVILFLDYIGYDDDPESLKGLKTSDINKYMEHIKCNKNGEEKSATTRCASFYAINNFFEYLINEGYIDTNVCKKASRPKETKEKEVVSMTPEEIKKVEKHIIEESDPKYKNRDLCIFVLGCTTGLRVSSIQEINLEDIDYDNKTITVVEKGNKIRTCHIGDRTVSLIKEWLNDRKKMLTGHDKCDALFISNRRQRMSTLAIRHVLDVHTSILDKHITPHKMRSSCATNLYDQTGDIYLVQEYLGHKNITNTRRYARVSSEQKEKAVNIMEKLF